MLCVLVAFDIGPAASEAEWWVATPVVGEPAPPRVPQFPESALMPPMLPLTPPPKPKRCAEAGGDELDERISRGKPKETRDLFNKESLHKSIFARRSWAVLAEYDILAQHLR